MPQLPEPIPASRLVDQHVPLAEQRERLAGHSAAGLGNKMQVDRLTTELLAGSGIEEHLPRGHRASGRITHGEQPNRIRMTLEGTATRPAHAARVGFAAACQGRAFLRADRHRKSKWILDRCG